MTETPHSFSRRQFLQLAGSAAVALFSPPPPEDDGGNFLFINIEGLPVMGAKTPLSGKEFRGWLETNNKKQETIDPLARPIEILVGHEAWNNGYDGESCAAFIRRHIDGFNLILGSSFPESGIQNMRVLPHIIVANEQWIQSLGWQDRQLTTNEPFKNINALGRWTLDSTYIPRTSAYRFFIEGKHYDSGLWHEWQHYWLYQSDHSYNHFLPTLDNWQRVELQHKELRGYRPGHIKHWNRTKTLKEFQTHSLHDVNHLRWDEMKDNNQSPFSRFEQRMIKLVSELPDMGEESWFYGPSYPMQLCENGTGLAETYNFTVNQKDSLKAGAFLYAGRVKTWDVNSSQANIFDIDPKPLLIENRHIAISADKLAGRATDQEEYKSATKYFLLQVGDRIYGFTSLHLLNWHFEEQQKQSGVFGPRQAKSEVFLNLIDFR